MRLVTSLRDFITRVDTQHREIISGKKSQTMSPSGSNVENKMLGKVSSDQLPKLVISEYDREFKERAILIRKEMLSRLPTHEEKGAEAILYAFPTNLLGMKQVADNLAMLSDRLCPL
jgi:hypothetical protein